MTAESSVPSPKCPECGCSDELSDGPENDARPTSLAHRILRNHGLHLDYRTMTTDKEK